MQNKSTHPHPQSDLVTVPRCREEPTLLPKRTLCTRPGLVPIFLPLETENQDTCGILNPQGFLTVTKRAASLWDGL